MLLTNQLVVIDIRDAETQFNIDEFHDLYSRTKPTIYIKLADIFAVHNLIVSELATICPSQDDVLREVIRELGSAKNNESELIHVSSNEITLTLSPKLHEKEGKFASKSYSCSVPANFCPQTPTPQSRPFSSKPNDVPFISSVFRLVLTSYPLWCNQSPRLTKTVGPPS